MPIEPMGPVVVGVDGSPASLAAVELAAEEAVGRVAPLVVVHARGEHARFGAAEQPGQLDAARRVLAVAAGRARAEHPGLSVTEKLVPGDPAEALLARSRDACLLVVGYRGRHALGGAPLGSVAIRVIGGADVPIIVHRPLDTSIPVHQPRPVLVGVTAAGSDAVVEFGFAEAALRGAPLLAMLVWPPPGGTGPIGDAAAGRQEADQVLREALAGWADKYPDVDVCRLVRRGLDVPVALTATSHSAQLVVVGSAHRADLARRTASSVSQVLVHRAGCPVAVIPVHSVVPVR
ncbi:MAG TPA: universal stress protein [Micromonosporaceae bacterium]|nr:universal stress protein [Micromonosporaceae bacterium]